MPHRRRHAEPRVEAVQPLRRQRDLRQQHQRLAALRHALGDGFEVDLGLAGPGYAVQQGDAEAAAGDGAAQAARALSGNPATPWRTDWYATPYFGGLYSGTGLLVDLGRSVTVTSVGITVSGGA